MKNIVTAHNISVVAIYTINVSYKLLNMAKRDVDTVPRNGVHKTRLIEY